ncbi:MAG: ABC transporter permease subunit/CPBP intramembrane protease [Acidobacteriota bacterium]
MRWPILRTVFVKELRETLRDRRTLLMAIGLPVLVYPLIIIGFSRIAESGESAIASRASTVAVWGALPAEVEAALGDQTRLALKPWEGAPPEVRAALEAGALTAPALRNDEERRTNDEGRRANDERVEESGPVIEAARAAITRRQVESVVVLWPGFAERLGAGDEAALTVYFDSVRRESEVARNRVTEALREYRARVIARRVAEQGLPRGFSTALDIRASNVAQAERRAGRLLGTLLPYMLLSLAVLGGLYAAIDLTAGEKERGTMQTLLCAPITASEIVVGKFLAVWTLSLISVLANLLSLSLTISRLLPADVPSLGAANYVMTALVLLPVTLTTSALFLAVSSFARSFRDGQSMVTPVYMAVALPAAVVMLPTVELDAWTAFVPIVNIALLIKGLFLREVSVDLAFLTLTSAMLYAVLTIALAVRVFHRETVLLGGKESVRGVLGLDGKPGGLPTPSLAVSFFAVVLVLQFYGSLALRDQPIPTLLLILQYGGMLLPSLLVVAAFRFDWKRTLALRMPGPTAVLLSIVIGLTAWIFAAGVVARLLPPPENLQRAMERLIRLGDDPYPLWVVWLVIGLTPGICEELLFRGVIMSGFRRMGGVAAVALTALLFGLAHASIYRLLPTATLGLVLGIVTWRTGSIVCAIIVHAVNNAFIATLAQRPEIIEWAGITAASTEIPWTFTALGSGVFLVALGLIARNFEWRMANGEWGSDERGSDERGSSDKGGGRD